MRGDKKKVKGKCGRNQCSKEICASKETTLPYKVEKPNAIPDIDISPRDILILPESFMKEHGITEEYLKSNKVDYIIFEGSSLLKPSIIKT